MGQPTVLVGYYRVSGVQKYGSTGDITYLILLLTRLPVGATFISVLSSHEPCVRSFGRLAFAVAWAMFRKDSVVHRIY